jgi:hypothetical protein
VRLRPAGRCCPLCMRCTARPLQPDGCCSCTTHTNLVSNTHAPLTAQGHGSFTDVVDDWYSEISRHQFTANDDLDHFTQVWCVCVCVGRSAASWATCCRCRMHVDLHSRHRVPLLTRLRTNRWCGRAPRSWAAAWRLATAAPSTSATTTRRCVLARVRWRVCMCAAGVPAQALQDSVAVTTRAATTAPLWRSCPTATGQHGGRLQQQRVPGQVQVMAWLFSSRAAPTLFMDGRACMCL